MASKTSPILCVLLLVFLVAIRGLLLLPSNDEINAAFLPRNQIIASPPARAIHTFGRNHALTFVHVGKTGGETIQWRLKLSCSLRKSKRKKARCTQQFQSGESFISRATIGYLHCDKVKPRGIIRSSSMFMVSLRDPIDRIVSWFQYMHPLNCLPDRPSGACNLKKDNNPWGLAFYGDCFPDVNDFVRALKVPVSNRTIDCSAMATETVQGRGPEGPTNHMFFNYNYYANKTIFTYPEKEVLVVRQEMLWDDLRGIELLFGGNPLRAFETEGPTITHGSEHFRYRAHLDPVLVPVLCCAIPLEIFGYKEFLMRASNLERAQKSSALKALLHKCDTNTIDELRVRCDWK